MKPEDLSNYEKIEDLTKNRQFLYLLVSEDLNTAALFDGTEQEMLDLWDKMAALGHRITRVDHTMVWTADNNPFTGVTVI